jgi:hypothetical protein
MRLVIRWLYLNFKYRVWPLPTDPASLQKIAMDLRVPLAFTYTWHRLDVPLAQRRIHESLKSFRWSVPLVLVILSLALVIGCIISQNAQHPLFHLLGLCGGFVQPRLKISPAVFPSQVVGDSAYCQLTVFPTANGNRYAPPMRLSGSTGSSAAE